MDNTKTVIDNSNSNSIESTKEIQDKVDDGTIETEKTITETTEIKPEKSENNEMTETVKTTNDKNIPDNSYSTPEIKKEAEEKQIENVNVNESIENTKSEGITNTPTTENVPQKDSSTPSEPQEMEKENAKEDETAPPKTIENNNIIPQDKTNSPTKTINESSVNTTTTTTTDNPPTNEKTDDNDNSLKKENADTSTAAPSDNNNTPNPVEVKKKIKKNHTNLKKTSISTIQPLIIRKGAASSYLKGNYSYLNEGHDVSLDPEKNYSDVIVIHPGSRYLRIGRASDAFPIQIPHCIARDISPLKKTDQKDTNTTPDVSENKVDGNENKNSEEEGVDKMEGVEPTHPNQGEKEDHEEDEHANKRRKGNDSSRISIDTDSDSSTVGPRRSLRSKNRHRNNNNDDEEEDDQYIYSDELIINKEYIKKLETDIKFRMRLAKMRVTPNAHSQVQQYNVQSIPEIIPDHNDPYKIEWTSTENHEKYFVGLKALRLKSYAEKSEDIKSDSDPRYKLFFPVKYGTFNLEDYTNLRVVLGDIERIWSYALINELGIKRNEFQNYNVVLVIPDIFDKVYVVELINLLLKEMNFKAIIVQQESPCAAFGAGFSMSCIVDIGAQKTSISCIEDGFCIPETRLNLKYGGDDITKLFMALLIHNSFPYSEIDLNRIYDWQLAQELKERSCTVIESDLTCRVYTFYVRAPDKDTRLYSLKVYDEVVMAPMLLFNTHMIDFKNKFHYLVDSKKNYMNEVTVEEIVRLNEYIKSQNATHTNTNTQTTSLDNETNSEYPSPNTSSTVNIKEDVKMETSSQHKPSKPNSMDIDTESVEESKSHDDHEVKSINVNNSNNNNNNNTNNNNNSTTNESSDNDIFERISQPLDVAIAQSISTYVTTISEGTEFTGTNTRKEKDIEDRIRKIYSSILVIGGGGMIPGLSKMIEDRVSHWLHVLLPQGILNSAIQHEIKNDSTEDKRRTSNKKGNAKGAPQRKGPGGAAGTGTGTAIISPTVITSPRDMDSRVLTWKGASILSKLDCATEMWVGAKEWENGGIKGCYKWLFLWD